MKITNELLNRLIAEQMERLDEKKLPIKLDVFTPAAAKLTTDYRKTDAAKSRAFKKVKTDLGIPPAGRFAVSTSMAGAFKELMALIKQADPKTSLDVEDIKAAKPGTPEYETLLSIAKYTDDPDLRKEIRDAIKKAHFDTFDLPSAEQGKIGTQGDIEQVTPETFTYPRVMNSDASLGAGAFLKSQNTLIKTIFKEPTIKGRLDKFSAISKSIWKELDQQLDPRETLQKINFLDMINFYMNEQDSRTGGYLFEALCAILCGGKVIGGDNGVADFVTANGNNGSSKLYKEYSNITQAAANFKIGQSVHYIMGIYDAISLNEEEEEEIQKDVKKSVLRLNYAICTLVSTKGTGKKDSDGNPIMQGEFHVTNADGTLLSTQYHEMKTKTKLDVIKGTKERDTNVGELKFYSGPTESFKKAIDTSFETRADSVKKATVAMKGFFKELFKAEQETKTYIASGKESPKDIIKSGDSAIKSFDKADGFLVELLNALAVVNPDSKQPGLFGTQSPATVKGEKGQRQFSENNEKITPELLDKLIKAVILES